MADPDTDADIPAVNLRILSPSPDLDGGINLTQLPATTTVADLRRRIQHAVPSRPAPDHMRLIYRGKVVANNASTLLHVFGADNIRQSPDQSLHLVLRELPAAAASPSTSASPAPRSATAPAPFRTHDALPASPPLSTNPFRALPRPSSQPPLPHHHHPHHHHHHVQQQPLNPLAANPVPNPILATPMPPHIQHQLANALAPGLPSNPLVPGTPVNHPPNPGAIRQEGIGPNGERWSVTINDFTANAPLRPGQPMMSRPLPFPAAFRVPPRPAASPTPDVSVPVSWLLPRLRDSLREAALEMANVSALLQAHTSPPQTGLPPWRIQRVRGHLRTVIHSMQVAESALSNPVLQLNTDVIAMRQSAAQLRRQAEEIGASLDRQQVNIPATAQPGSSQTSQTLPSDAPPELFILSSPQGPVGVLFDQRGTYTTAPMAPVVPMAPNAPMHNFVDQFTRNRHLIAGLGHQMTLVNQHGAPRPTPTQPSQDTTQNQAQNQDATQIQNQNQNHNQPQNQNQNQDQNADGENDRLMNIGGHLWLVFKLACFVYIFAGGGGWYRPIILALMAAAVYLAQLGIFNDQLNVVRRHFEALLPNTDRLVQGHEATPQQQRPGARNMTPEEAARRILQQHQQQRFSWARDTMRTLERSFAIFVASLWPGIGERMVHAQEERVRAERAAEEAQREEEQRRIEAEAQQKEAEESVEKSVEKGTERGEDEKSGPPTEKSQQIGLKNEAVPGADEASAGESMGSSAKGKERAETAA